MATDANVLGINDCEHINDVVMDEVLLEKLDLLLKASNCRKQFIGRVVLDLLRANLLFLGRTHPVAP